MGPSAMAMVGKGLDASGRLVDRDEKLDATVTSRVAQKRDRVMHSPWCSHAILRRCTLNIVRGVLSNESG